MKLYICTHTNDDGENMDLVIQETSPERAADAWRNFWIEGNVIDESHFDGKFYQIPEWPVPSGDECLRVFEIIADADVSGVLDWHVEKGSKAGGVKLIGYVYF